MGFSPKRLKALKEGRVRYRIYNGELVIFETPSFITAVQMADQLQKANPGTPYTMKLEEVE